MSDKPLEEKPPYRTNEIIPSQKEVEAALEESKMRITSGNVDLRILGLHAKTTWISDDFDDPLPDEFWLGDKL